MKPEDDPEQRIRDLERPLADTARASELGSEFGHAQAYPPPPPGPVPPPAPGPAAPPLSSPPPAPSPYGGYGGYGDPYAAPAPAPQRSSGKPLFWILAAVFIVGTLVVVGGVAAYVSHRISASNIVLGSQTPAVSTPALSPTPPRTKTRTPNSSTPSQPSAGPASTAPQGAPLTVSGIEETKTVACNDNTVTVSGISNAITITGHCNSLTVSGQKNSVTVDAADTIEATGIDNRVIFHSGSPQMNTSGIGNSIQPG